MPAILDPSDYARWLGQEETSQYELLAMLRPAPAEMMECFPVGAAVGNVKNQGASLAEPLSA
jgi:putative SOS response-associated peptidase YedK